MKPLLYIVERFCVCDIIDDDNTVSAAVVTAGDSAESLLTSCVPNLKLDRLSIQLNGSNLKVNANGADVWLSVGIIGETQQQARLANTRVANEKQLEQVIAKRKQIRLIIWTSQGVYTKVGVHLLIGIHSVVNVLWSLVEENGRKGVLQFDDVKWVSRSQKQAYVGY